MKNPQALGNKHSLSLKQTAGNSPRDESSAAASSTWRNCGLGLCCLPTPSWQKATTRNPSYSSSSWEGQRKAAATCALLPIVPEQNRAASSSPQSSEAPKVTVLFKSRLRGKYYYLLLLKHVTKAWQWKNHIQAFIRNQLEKSQVVVTYSKVTLNRAYVHKVAKK